MTFVGQAFFYSLGRDTKLNVFSEYTFEFNVHIVYFAVAILFTESMAIEVFGVVADNSGSKTIGPETQRSLSTLNN